LAPLVLELIDGMAMILVDVRSFPVMIGASSTRNLRVEPRARLEEFVR
jgi:hypothetical protein